MRFSDTRLMLTLAVLLANSGATRAAMAALATTATPAPTPTFELTLQDVTMLPAGGPSPSVIGGDPADASMWPATFVFKNAQGGGCTATAVGRRVLLTAAHCIHNGATGSAKAGNVSGTVKCRHHPSYPADHTADFALCTIDKALPKLGSGFEIVNANSALPAKGAQITLLGYGCRTKGGGDHHFGTLYKGQAHVVEVPTANLYTRTAEGAAVCFGDSGGGAYVWMNQGMTVRRLFGVNSRGDISANSWLSTTANDSFRKWATEWARDADVRICGLDASAEDCRQ